LSKYQPKTPIQEEYNLALTNPNTHLIVAIGPAGTGKSLFACSNAIQTLKEKKIEKIILTRPLVSVADEDIGFLPGSLNNKMSIWVQPMLDIFSEYMPKKEIAQLIQSGAIEITPLLYMRGRTFKNTMIIADEIQNTTPQQLLMLLTRCGENSKIVLTGDLKQSDIKGTNGLQDFIDKHKRTVPSIHPFLTSQMSKNEIIKIIEFKTADVQRSELIKHILNIYNPLHATSTSTFNNKEYMNKINNGVSKIPIEYGDYLIPEKTSPTTDCALIPYVNMKKTTTSIQNKTPNKYEPL
jgi:phosphate starvation-inducible PhoH-like protein